MKRRSILSQLVIPMVTIVSAFAVCLVLVVVILFANSYEKEVYHKNQDKSQLIAGEIKTFLDGTYNVTEELSVNPSILTMDTQVQTPILESCVARNEYLELLYVQGTDGMQTGRSSGNLADRSTRWWFTQIMKEQNAFVSKSYYSVNTGMPCASIFFPMHRDGKMIGVFAVDLKLNYLQSLIEQFSNKENGEYSYIIDGEGVVVAHPDSMQIEEQFNYKLLLKTVSQTDTAGNVMTDENGNILTTEEMFDISKEYQKVISDVMQGENGSVKINCDGQKSYVSYASITLKGTSDSWSVITIHKASEAMKLVYRVILIAAIVSILVIIIAIIIITLLAKKLTKPVIEITSLIGNASEGDFTVLADESNKNELGSLAKSFNILTTKISTILTKITTFSAKVIDSAANMQDIYKNAGTINQEIHEISEGSESQLQDAQKVLRRANELEEKFRELGTKSEEMMSGAQETMESGKQGSLSIEELKQQNMVTTEQMVKSNEKIMALNEQSLEIVDIVNTISGISEQTSLLALNASIEAARAGEQGKGFAVVAESIGKLASESGQAATDIKKIIESLCDDIKGTVDTMEEIKQQFTQQSEFVLKVQTVVENFQNLADNTEKDTHQIVEMITEMHKLERSVVHAAQHICDISENTAATSEKVIKVLSQQNIDIDSVTLSIDNLSQVSNEVEQEMSKFKLS